MNRKAKFPECRYIVKNFEVIDTKKEVNNGCEIYIREVLDSCCCEYNKSKLTNEERLDIINQLGLDNLIALLDECFTVNHKGYNAKVVAYSTVWCLTGDRQFMDKIEEIEGKNDES